MRTSSTVLSTWRQGLLRPALIGLIASVSTLSACTADSSTPPRAAKSSAAQSSPSDETDPVRPRPQPWAGRPVAAAPPSPQADLQVLAAAVGIVVDVEVAGPELRNGRNLGTGAKDLGHGAEMHRDQLGLGDDVACRIEQRGRGVLCLADDIGV